MFFGAAAVGVLAAGGAHVSATRSVETLGYSVVKKHGDFELRCQLEMALAQVMRAVTPRDLVQSGFSPLVHYVSAKDCAAKEIAMTAPLVQ